MFSIVIPVFNTERYLTRCLDSIRAQTERDFEVLVVDDASPGNASEIVARYDDRFRCIRHETNRSAFQARCTGVAAAKGDYIVPVDPDDYLTPETLAKVRETIERESPDVISYWMDYDDGKKVYPHWCRHPAATVSGSVALRELVDHRYFTGVASKVFRREVLLSALDALNAPASLYINTSDDFLMLLPMLMKSAKVSFLDYAGYRYFVNADSTSFSWKTPEGFRRACEQTHAVGESVLRMAASEAVSPEVRIEVEKAVSGIERWFVQMAVEQSGDQWPEYGAVLLKTLAPDNVAREMVTQMTALRVSRVYRLAKLLARLKSMLKSS